MSSNGPLSGNGPPTLIVDSDVGIDDALAILLLARHRRGSEVSIELLTVVRGNVSLAQATANARYVVRAADLPDVPVCPGADAALLEISEWKPAFDYHGPAGLGPVVLPREHLDHHPDAAALAIIDKVNTVHGGGGTCQLLCIGPLTNLARAFLIKPALAGFIELVTIMGGALGDPGGNVEPWAEFNILCDPEAARIVFESGVPIRLVPLDCTERVLVQEQDLAPEGLADLARDLLVADVVLHRAAGHQGAFVHDAIAALTIVDPDLFEFVDRRVIVHSGPPTAGRTEVDPEGIIGALVQVAVPKDPALVRSAMLDALLGAVF